MREQPMVPGTMPLYELYGALKPMGFHGLVIGSVVDQQETIWDLLLTFPSRYSWCDSGDDIAWWLERTAALHTVLDEEFSVEPSIGQQVPLVMGTLLPQPLSKYGPRVNGTTFRDRSGVEIVLGTSQLAEFHDTARLTERGKESMPFGESITAATLIVDKLGNGRLQGEVLSWAQDGEALWLAEYPLGVEFTRGTFWLRQRLAELLAYNIMLDRLTPGAQANMRSHLVRIHRPNDDVQPDEILESWQFVARLARQFYGHEVKPALLVAAERPWLPEFLGTDEEPELADALEHDVEPTVEQVSGAPVLPPPRLVKNAAAAEAYAAEVMRALGFADAAATPIGSDGGIDVVAGRAIAQVKMEAVATSRPAIQAIAGVAWVEEKLPIFFSLAGYTQLALQWAAKAGVACFEFEFDGSITARTERAQALLVLGMDALEVTTPAIGSALQPPPDDPDDRPCSDQD